MERGNSNKKASRRGDTSSFSYNYNENYRLTTFDNYIQWERVPITDRSCTGNNFSLIKYLQEIASSSKIWTTEPIETRNEEPFHHTRGREINNLYRRSRGTIYDMIIDTS